MRVPYYFKVAILGTVFNSYRCASAEEEDKTLNHEKFKVTCNAIGVRTVFERDASVSRCNEPIVRDQCTV